MSDLVPLHVETSVNNVVFHLESSIEHDAELDLALAKIKAALNNPETMDEYDVHGAMLDDPEADEEILAMYVMQTAGTIADKYTASVNSVLHIPDQQMLIVNVFVGYHEDGNEWD